MKIQHKTILAARVAAVNRANSIVNEIAPLYRGAITPFLGQKVIKANGEYLEKVKKAFPVLPPSADAQIYSPHLGCFVVKVSENYSDHSCVYAEPYFYAFYVNQQGIAEAARSEFVPLRTDYTVTGVTIARTHAEELEEMARKAKAECEPFGMFDR